LVDVLPADWSFPGAIENVTSKVISGGFLGRETVVGQGEASFA
jgi:hypothetical protein